MPLASLYYAAPSVWVQAFAFPWEFTLKKAGGLGILHPRPESAWPFFLLENTPMIADVNPTTPGRFQLMTLNKKLITAAVGASLALSAGAASAYTHNDYNSILFPYVVKDANRTTVITLIIDPESRTKGNQDLHIQYWTKDTSAANTAACQPSSSFMGVTPNDIVTFDSAGILGYPLFGDTTNAAPLGTSIAYAGPRHGYLVVNDNQGDLNGGFWLELDFANGGAYGDIGLGSFDDTDIENETFSPFSLDHDFITSINNASPVIFWPASVASTAFTVTPLGTNMLNSDNNNAVMQVFNDNEVQGAYDRNENGVDGTVPQTVRCVGRLTAAQLMPGVVANAAWAAQGGWGYLANLGNGNSVTDDCSATGDCKTVVYQVDTSNAAGTGKFMSNATMIRSYNSGD